MRRYNLVGVGLSVSLVATVVATLVATLGNVGCGAVEPGPAPPRDERGPSSSASTTAASAEPPGATAAATTSAAPAASATGDDRAKALERARAMASCEAPRSSITNHPDGGVVFNNAMTSADAGFIDRNDGIIEALAARGEALRCCFDGWVQAHPEADSRVLLRVELAPDGAVQSTAIEAGRSNVDDELVRLCVEEVARATSFPSSPSNKPTVVEYPVHVSALER